MIKRVRHEADPSLPSSAEEMNQSSCTSPARIGYVMGTGSTWLLQVYLSVSHIITSISLAPSHGRKIVMNFKLSETVYQIYTT